MNIAQAFWDVLINPNVAYILLIVGLWALLAAFAMPGTGIPEAASAICLLLALMGLARLPVSAIGAALIALSVILLIADLKVQSHGAMTAGGIIALALGSIFLFQPVGGQPLLSPWIIAITTLSSAVFFGVALTLVMRAHKRPAVMEPTAVAGQTGEVRVALNPIGTVQLRSELWSAKSETPGETIEAGARVVVTGLEGLTLIVRRQP